MSMNAMHLAAHARAQGLGDLGLSLPGGGFDWMGVINRGFDFGNNFINQKYAKDAAKYTGGGGGVNYQNQYGALPPAAPPGGVGVGVDGQGIRLSDGSHIGWPLIALGVGAIFLLQSPGYSRRGR